MTNKSAAAAAPDAAGTCEALELLLFYLDLDKTAGKVLRNRWQKKLPMGQPTAATTMTVPS